MIPCIVYLLRMVVAVNILSDIGGWHETVGGSLSYSELPSDRTGSSADLPVPTSMRFSVSEGSIIAPDGNPFVAKGINIYSSQVSADLILSTFPSINMVRIAAKISDTPSTFYDFVSTLTAHKVVIEIENHSIGTVMTGLDLVEETNWYASLASTL